jgi:hypothetical protein
MKTNGLFLTIIIMLSITESILAQPNWQLTKSNTTLNVALPAEFGTPTVQPVSVNGWEDGIFITRDGLNLYCIYLPIDALSWTLAGGSCNYLPYQKGPTFGMDLTTSPTTACPNWMHADILKATRASTTTPFTSWTLSNMATSITSEGAPQMLLASISTVDIMVYTSNQLPPYNTDIYMIRGGSINPSNTGTILPSTITDTTTEDNPHIERLSATQLVLFFDSPDRTGGVGGLDLWYSISNDDGVTWINPVQVSSLNTIANEHQPHLYRDALNQWWMYYATPDGSGKYAIYRSQQTIVNNWNAWGPKQLVIGPGNSAGIGEPTLTQNGDLSFVVVYEDSNGTSTDKFDADPWFLPKLSTVSVADNLGVIPSFEFYPNPAKTELTLNIHSNDEYEISISNLLGQVLIKNQNLNYIDISSLTNGIYIMTITQEQNKYTQKFIKE